jgi:DNA polymerase-3 subunit alpha
VTDFVHLHNHSEYSLLDAIARPGDIATRCVELGYDAFALTDHGVMYGAMEFYLAMRERELKPIIGCEVYIAPRTLKDKDHTLDRRAWHLVLLAMDITGYRNLMKLASIAATDGFYYNPRIDVPTLMQHNKGLVALTACPGGVLAGPFHRESEQAARDNLERYLRIFGEERLFVEIQNHGLEIEQKFIPFAVDTAKHYGLRLVATNDCHYVLKDDARPHDIALCLRDGKTVFDKDRKRYDGEEYYIKSPSEMAALFPEHPEALANTRVVADMCNVELDLEQVHFPRFTVSAAEVKELTSWVEEHPEQAGTTAEFGDTSNREHLENAFKHALKAGEMASSEETRAAFEAYLRKKTYEGAQKRYGEVTQELAERIEYELSVIIPKGFTTYFLICAEFCQFARSQNIPVGPGRGSAAGSVVAYCLEVTDLEPIKYGLYFERFLNPERIELPDFDIDFCKRRRGEVIEHIRQRYGHAQTAQIITFNRLKARAAIKSVGRAKGLEFQYVNRITAEIKALEVTIDEAIAANPQLRKLIDGDPEMQELVDDARRLEGIASHHGVHAAGVVIAPTELPDYVPVQAHKKNDWLVTQYAMENVPLTGLVKFDFLGLRNLTMIQDTLDYIAETTGEEVDLRQLDDHDADTYAALQKGDGYGVFQFEAPQVKRMLQEARPANVQDLAAINAANRPGPLESGNTERYLQSRRTGRPVGALYPSIAEILESTGGQLLFQEQVMEIARKLGGFTLGEADVLRKAMGKKKLDVMAKLKVKFMAGVEERGIVKREAEDIWDMMEQFAKYGFNKAHSVCYSWIGYQTAYLKAHYPHHYMAAMLNSWLGEASKIGEILAQCRQMRIDVEPPSVCAGNLQFTPTPEGNIIFGLVGIKGVGENAVRNIITERKAGGPFSDGAEFLRRLKGKGVNRKVLQSLAIAGALDCLGLDRVELLKNLQDIENFLRGPSKQEALFGAFEDSTPGTTPDKQVSALDVALLEKEAVGVYLSGHPFQNHPMFRDRGYLQLADIQESVSYNPTLWQSNTIPRQGLAGLLAEVNVRTARSRKQYARARLEDPARSLAVFIAPKVLEEYQELVMENRPVVLWGRVQLPDTLDATSEESDNDTIWGSLEVIVDRIAPYQEIDPEPGHAGASTKQVAASREPASPQSAAVPAPAGPKDGDNGASGDSFAPLQINIELDLNSATYDDLQRFAQALEQAEGAHEVRMEIREVSGHVRRLKPAERFMASPETTRELASEFPFITFLDTAHDDLPQQV